MIGLFGTLALFKKGWFFGQVWGCFSMTSITYGIAAANLYFGLWVLNFDDPYVNFLWWIGWGVLGVVWPVKPGKTCQAQNARPRRNRKRKPRQNIINNGVSGRQNVDLFGFHGSHLCKAVIIATKVGSVRHKGPGGSRGSRFRMKCLVPLRWLNCHGDTLTNGVKLVDNEEVTKETVETLVSDSLG